MSDITPIPVRGLTPEFERDLKIAQAAISQEFGPYGPNGLVSDQRVNEFAVCVGDFNPLHIDAQAAAHGPFKHCVGHGLLLIGLATGYARPDSPFKLDRMPVMYGFGRIAFLRPVMVGEVVRVRERVAAAEFRRLAGIVVTSEFEIEVSFREQFKLAATGEILIAYN